MKEHDEEGISPPHRVEENKRRKAVAFLTVSNQEMKQHSEKGGSPPRRVG